MSSLHVSICDIIDDRDDLNYTTVADAIGVTVQYMSKFRKTGSIGFRKLHKLSFVLSSESKEQSRLMSSWCMGLDSVESVTQSFEYAAITRNIRLLSKLLLKHKKETGIIKEYVDVYNILLDYIEDRIGGLDIIPQLEKIGQPTDKSLRVLTQIMKCYSYYFQKKFTLMFEVAKEVERMIDDLGDKRKIYLRDCYLHRLAEILAPIHLRLNNLEKARKYAFIIINSNICAKTVSDALYIVGTSFLTEDDKKCIEYLQKSYEISKEVESEVLTTEAKYNLEMAELYIKISRGGEQIHFINIEKLVNQFYQKENEDFLVFFKAVQSNSIDTLYECLQRFFSQSNYFFSSLVAKHLYKIGETSVMVKWMMDYKKD